MQMHHMSKKYQRIDYLPAGSLVGMKQKTQIMEVCGKRTQKKKKAAMGVGWGECWALRMSYYIWGLCTTGRGVDIASGAKT